MKERFVFNAVGIEPTPVRELLEPGSPAFPYGSPAFSDFHSGSHRPFELFADGLGDEVAERTPLLCGERLGFSKQRIGQIEGRFHFGSIYSSQVRVKLSSLGISPPSYDMILL